jgi:YesN/AraC family two-component response regulator
MARSAWGGTLTTDILLVDDETPFLNSLVEGLRIYAGNLNIITAENGKKAMEILKTIAVDLVITDLKMPVMDGFELLEYLKTERPGTRVMVMSMLDSPEIQARLKGLGVNQFIEKPIDFRAIINKILTS